MFAHAPEAPLMFAGVARPHRIRDLAIIALSLAFIGGFVAQAVNPGPRPSAEASDLWARGLTVTAPCPDLMPQ